MEFRANLLQPLNLRQDNTAADCKHKIVGNYAYGACRFMSSNGSLSAWQVWYYDNQKDSQKRFYALNGTARSTYETYLTSNPILADYEAGFGLPMPDDMKLDEIIKAFN